MRIKTIHVEYQRKTNLGNFESLAPSVSAWADLDKDEGDLHTAKERYDELMALCRQVVMDTTLNLIRQKTNLVLYDRGRNEIVSNFPFIVYQNGDKKNDQEPADDLSDVPLLVDVEEGA